MKTSTHEQGQILGSMIFVAYMMHMQFATLSEFIMIMCREYCLSVGWNCFHKFCASCCYTRVLVNLLDEEKWGENEDLSHEIRARVCVCAHARVCVCVCARARVCACVRQWLVNCSQLFLTSAIMSCSSASLGQHPSDRMIVPTSLQQTKTHLK